MMKMTKPRVTKNMIMVQVKRTRGSKVTSKGRAWRIMTKTMMTTMICLVRKAHL